MIELDVRLPLRAFDLHVVATLPGRVNAVVGPSGSGKTSLLEAIAGIRKGVEGRVVVDGTSFLELPAEKRQVGFVPQDAALFPHLTVRQNILFSRNVDGLDNVVRILEIEPLLHSYPSRLSGGEKQRVALARALMSQPRVLLLDEPFAAIDQPLRERLILYMRRVRDAFGIPIIHVTHQIVEAMALADYALVLQNGRVISKGPAEQVLHNRAVAGREAFENVMSVSEPEHHPDRGVTYVRTTDGLRLALASEDTRDAQFPLLISVSGEDVVVFSEPPRALSARNVFAGVISKLEIVDGTVELTVDTPGAFYLRTTAEAAADLRLQTGSRVWLALRALAIRVIG
jgi:molybdate transport system ATP-binding protein